MKLNKYYETELNVRDLFFHVLYQWRILLLVGLVAAAFFGHREYKKDLTSAMAQYEANVASNQEAIARAEKDIAAYEELIEDTTNYRDTSVLMKMDPKNIWTAEKIYFLNLDGSPVDHSAETITKLLESFSQDISDETLIDVFDTSARNDIDEIASISAHRGLRTIYVIGCGNTEEEALKRKAFVDSYLSETVKKLQETFVFSLETVSDNIGTKTVLTTRNNYGDRVEKDLASTQNVVSENIRLYQDQQKTYINNLNNLKSQTFTEPTKHIVKQAILGFALGLFIVIVICILVYLFNGKIKTSRELRNRYDLSLLCEMNHSRAWRKNKGLDRVIERLEFGKKTTMENELDNVSFLIDNEKYGKKILLTGTLEEEKMKEIYKGLSSRLQEKGINLTLEANYLHNSKAVAASSDLDSVILVEEKYKSKIKELNRMAEMLTIENANVIGAVLL